MARDARKFGLLPVLTASRAWRTLTPPACLMIVATLLCVPAASGAESGKAAAGAGIPGAQIAIADFDGDQNPDSASILSGASTGAHTSYSIRLRLTAAGRQSIQITGPAGGLEIAARDVNGDHAIDLVLTTAWFKQPVAILLNDGHGNFSRVDPADFPGAFENADSVCGERSASTSAAVANVSEKGAQNCVLAENAFEARPAVRLARSPDSPAEQTAFLTSIRCRAPPQHASNF